MKQSFVHLHLHSEFSLADGIVRLEPLAEKCAEFQQPAVALTDWSNLYGAVKFYRACLSQGIKPIIGCDVWIENPMNAESFDRVSLLCKDNNGYKNLSRMLTNAYLEGGKKGKIAIPWKEFSKYHAGLICLLDDHEGPVANLVTLDSEHSIQGVIDRYQQPLGDRLYLAVSRIGWPGEHAYISLAVQLSANTGIGLVATNRVEFINQDEFGAHEIRVCINDGRVLEDSRRPRKFTEQQFLKSTREMSALFVDIPAALENTVEISRRCNMFFNFGEDFLPDYPDTGGRPVATILRELAESGLANRMGVNQLVKPDGTALVGQEYIERLNLELGVIEEMGYPGYFLIVADFIRWSRENGIPVGPGRGSGAGSLVAWATGITEINPLLYGLLFERFLNPERVSLPDFDIDFCVDGRDRVIEYVAQRYGHDQVAQIITFGTMAAKAVVRDVGRVMSLPYGFVDQIAKLIPFVPGMTLENALNQEQLLRQRYEEEEDVQELIDSALQLEGIARNVGKHAGGVVIAPKPLTEYTPLYADSHLNQAITQLDKDDLEAIGLVKFDFLGLRTLTILDSAVKMANLHLSARNEPLLDLNEIPLDDEDTYTFISTGQTTAIFQLESRGMRELIMRANPVKFEDLVALIALFRPGPLQSGMVEDFVNRKNGLEPVQYNHPALESILNTTYGVILYQEQVMEIARSLAGYTLGGADLLRKAMGKKNQDVMDEQKETFLVGAVNRGTDKKVAEDIFNLMDKFAGYGFNKSHSAAYALVSYHTAWMKTHYPAAYMAATLSSDMDKTEKVVTLLADCQSLKLNILPPSINTSFYTFEPISDTEISYGLGALKGVGQGVIESIVSEREKNGPYQNLFDFCRRLDMRKVNKRVLEAMIKSGAMDDLGSNRAAQIADIGSATRAADQQQQNSQAGQHDMFGLEQDSLDSLASAEVADWSDEQRLTAEKETLGLYLTGHPYKRFSRELSGVCEHDVSALDLSTPRNGVFAGIMIAMRVLNTRRGKMAFVTLDNATHRVEVNLFSDKFSEYAEKLHKDSVLVALGELSTDEFTGGCQIRAEKLYEIQELRDEALSCIELHLLEKDLDRQSIKSLKKLLGEYRGGRAAVGIGYTRINGEYGRLNLGKDWKVKPEQNLLDELKDRFGEENIYCHYTIQPLVQAIPERPAYRQRVAANS
jgi:DNA polymerase-3 subunit alpha